MTPPACARPIGGADPGHVHWDPNCRPSIATARNWPPTGGGAGGSRPLSLRRHLWLVQPASVHCPVFFLASSRGSLCSTGSPGGKHALRYSTAKTGLVKDASGCAGLGGKMQQLRHVRRESPFPPRFSILRPLVTVHCAIVHANLSLPFADRGRARPARKRNRHPECGTHRVAKDRPSLASLCPHRPRHPGWNPSAFGATLTAWPLNKFFGYP